MNGQLKCLKEGIDILTVVSLSQPELGLVSGHQVSLLEGFEQQSFQVLPTPVLEWCPLGICQRGAMQTISCLMASLPLIPVIEVDQVFYMMEGVQPVTSLTLEDLHLSKAHFIIRAVRCPDIL